MVSIPVRFVQAEVPNNHRFVPHDLINICEQVTHMVILVCFVVRSYGISCMGDTHQKNEEIITEIPPVIFEQVLRKKKSQPNSTIDLLSTIKSTPHQNFWFDIYNTFFKRVTYGNTDNRSLSRKQ